MRQLAARHAGIMQGEDLQARISFEHGAHRFEGSWRVSANGKNCAIVLEVKIVGDQQIDGSGPVADYGAVERIIADIGFLWPGGGRLRFAHDQARRIAVNSNPPIPQAVEFRLRKSNRCRTSISPQEHPDCEPYRTQDQNSQTGSSGEQQGPTHDKEGHKVFPWIRALVKTAAQLVIKVFDAPANVAMRGDGIDRGLESSIGEGIFVLRFKRKTFTACRAFPVRSLFVLAVVTAVDALHSDVPGRR